MYMYLFSFILTLNGMFSIAAMPQMYFWSQKGKNYIEGTIQYTCIQLSYMYLNRKVCMYISIELYTFTHTYRKRKSLASLFGYYSINQLEMLQ